jgi:hypothetical protein
MTTGVEECVDLFNFISDNYRWTTDAIIGQEVSWIRQLIFSTNKMPAMVKYLVDLPLIEHLVCITPGGQSAGL